MLGKVIYSIISFTCAIVMLVAILTTKATVLSIIGSAIFIAILLVLTFLYILDILDELNKPKVMNKIPIKLE